ncbi:MAG: hypothetical protein OXI01_14355 [Albidovulum sp.]|nr:hypothetical protein [Albidovulum sp.]
MKPYGNAAVPIRNPRRIARPDQVVGSVKIRVEKSRGPVRVDVKNRDVRVRAGFEAQLEFVAEAVETARVADAEADRQLPLRDGHRVRRRLLEL